VRLGIEGVAEVILCTNPTSKESNRNVPCALLLPLGVKSDTHSERAARRRDLEYADELTLGRALEGRREVKG